jgi:hypothetical protein
VKRIPPPAAYRALRQLASVPASKREDPKRNKTGRGGSRTDRKKSYTSSENQTGGEGLAIFCTRGEVNPDLAAIIDGWPTLSAGQRRRILAIIERAGTKGASG